jgi:hypothetical protein
MAAYGDKYFQYNDFFQFYYGSIWLVMVYGLGLTRERSKVRSLVRPPSLSPRL